MTQTTKYARVLPRMGAERGKLLPENRIKALAESKSAADIAGQLRDSTYQEQIGRLATPITARKLERAYYENLIETYLKMIKYAPETANRYLNIYLERLEAENIKTLVRTASAGLSTEQRLAKVYLRRKHFDHIALMEEAVVPLASSGCSGFKNTDYGSALTTGSRAWESGSTTA